MRCRLDLLQRLDEKRRVAAEQHRRTAVAVDDLQRSRILASAPGRLSIRPKSLTQDWYADQCEYIFGESTDGQMSRSSTRTTTASNRTQRESSTQQGRRTRGHGHA
jgi:hypothetical protein